MVYYSLTFCQFFTYLTVIANLVKDFFVSSKISDSNFPGARFLSILLVVLDIVNTLPISRRPYRFHLYG